MAEKSWIDQKERYRILARSVDAAVILVTKSNAFWRAIAWSLWLITAGKFARQWFLEQAATTLGPIQAYPEQWPDIPLRLLYHESRHTRQARWLGLGLSPWIGLPLMGVAYLLLPLPMGFAAARFYFERDAELFALDRLRAETPTGAISASNPETGWSMGYQDVRDRLDAFADRLSSWNYAWAWPRSWAKRSLEAGARKLGLL